MRLLGGLPPVWVKDRNSQLLFGEAVDVECDLAAVCPCHSGIVKAFTSLQTAIIMLQAFGWAKVGPHPCTRVADCIFI